MTFVATQKMMSQLVENNLKLQEKTVDLISSINKLTKRMDNMVDIFDEAAKNIKSDQSQPLMKKLEDLIDQNKNIARGLILLEKYVKEKSAFSSFPPKPLPQTNL